MYALMYPNLTLDLVRVLYAKTREQGMEHARVETAFFIGEKCGGYHSHVEFYE